MKKKSLIIVGILIIIVTTILIGTIVTKNTSYAVDVSSNFEVTDAWLCSDESCTTTYDENNGIIGQSFFLIKLNWKYESSTPIQNGDTVSIPFANEMPTETITYWDGGHAAVDVKDNNNQKIGKWSVSTSSGSSRKLNITFSDKAVGQKSIEGTFITTISI